ncbi:aminoacyltransferase [Streptococcus sp. zg-JUN1979]|uniref:aminoacyltransferase n=1 Tax=Streptococcus sp. zg-JUN1979 TaxID=3391450 RepID=UPI0039A4250A
MVLRDISEQAFKAHILEAETSFFEQSPEMAALLTKRGHQVSTLGYYADDKLVISTLVYTTPVAGGLHMGLHNGPIVTDKRYLKDFYKALQDFAKRQKVISLVVKPYYAYQRYDSDGQATASAQDDSINLLTDLGYQHSGLRQGYTSGDWYYIKDLTDISADKLFASFSKKGKSLVKKAKTFGIKIHRLERDQLSLFKEITSATSERREFDDKPLEYYQYLFDSFGDKAEFLVASLNFEEYLANLQASQDKLKTKIDKLKEGLAQNPHSEKKQNQLRELSSQYDTFEVRKEEARDFIDKYGHEDVPLCASLFAYMDKEAYYLFSGSYPEFNKFYAPALLQEHVMLKAIKQGITSYNFLGIKGVFDGSDGVLRFKQNFNGYIIQTPGEFFYSPSPYKYKMIQAIKKLLKR